MACNGFIRDTRNLGYCLRCGHPTSEHNLKEKQMNDLYLDPPVKPKTNDDTEKLSDEDKGMVRSPKHYSGPLDHLNIELIDVMNAYNLNGNRSSIARYLFRAGIKNAAKEIEDLEKIVEYAEFEIRRLKGLPVSRTRTVYEMNKK